MYVQTDMYLFVYNGNIFIPAFIFSLGDTQMYLLHKNVQRPVMTIRFLQRLSILTLYPCLVKVVSVASGAL